MTIALSINMFKYPTIICETTDLSMNDWRRLRKDIYGGSDAAPIFGASRYKSPVAVYFDKIMKDEVDQNDSAKMEAGRRMEPVIAEWFAERTGKHVVRQPYMYAHPEYPWLGANVDFGIYGENAGLECKNSAYEADWKDGLVPDEYYLQCQHYMGVTGAKRWYLAYLLNGWNFNYVTIERNDDIIHELFAKINDFHHTHVLPQSPPVFDGSDSSKEVLKMLYPSEMTEQHDPVELSDDIDELWEEKLEIDKQLNVLETRKKEIQNIICSQIGDKSSGWSGFYTFLWRTISKKEFTVKATSYRQLTGKRRN